MSSEAQTPPDFWNRLGRTIARLLGFALRLVFILVLAAAIGAGVYFGLPYLYANLVQPVQNHSVEIVRLNNRLDNANTSSQNAQVVADERMTRLETAGDQQRQRLADSETQVAELTQALDAETAARAALAEELTATVASLQAELEAQDELLGAMRANLSDVQPTANQAADDVARLSREMSLLRIQNGLLRARLQLVDENLGELRRLLAASVDDLRAFAQTTSALSRDSQSQTALRLAAAEALIEEEPAGALLELETLWADLNRQVGSGAASAD